MSEQGQIQVEVDEIHVKQLMRGERPEGMDFEEFKIKRKAVQQVLKRKLKGYYINLDKNGSKK